MAGNIKGIKIEFEGDTTKLDKALRSVDKSTAAIDKELKQVNKDLKFNPNNVDLWKQKQTLLTEKVSETTKKLDALKQAQSQLDDDPAIDKNTAEYRELQREIIETESKLKHFEGQLKEIGNANLKVLGQQLEEVGGKVQAVGKDLTKYVTGPIVGAGTASVAAFQQVDEGLDIVNKKTGATGQELENMRGIAERLATELPTDFETAGTAVGEVATRFQLTGQDLEDLSEKFIKFADINNTDVNSAIDQTQKALAAFGMDATDAGTLLDQLNVVGQNTGVSMDTLLGGLVQNGTAFQELGLNAGQAATLMGQLETSGANSETVMQGLRKALKNAAEEGVPLDQALSDLQDTILNGTDGMDGLTAAYDLFGKSGDQIYGAVKNGTIDFSNLGVEAAAAGDSVNKTFEGMLDPGDQFAVMMNQLKDLGYQVAGPLLEMLMPALEKLGNFLKGLAERWQSMSPGTQKLIITIAGIVAAVGPVLMIIGSIITKLGMLMTFLPALAGILPVISGAFSALLGPIGLIIAAIAALVAIGIILYKNWDTIKEKASALFEHIKGVFGRIKEAITGPIKAAKDFIKKMIDKIKSFFTFKVSLPKIKLPHFSIKPKGWKLGDLLKGSIPSLGIDWYAQGGIFNSPSVIGVGEAGPEAVLPIEKLNGMLVNMADSIVNGVALSMRMNNNGGGDIVIPIYLYPSGPKMGEEIVKKYDTYKKILG